MSDIVVHALVNARIREISADAALCRESRREPAIPRLKIVPARAPRPATLLSLRDYLTAI